MIRVTYGISSWKYKASRRRRRKTIPNATHGAASPTPSPPAEAVLKKANRILWQILAAGFLTPILVGIAVKSYLQLSGRPHAEWSEILSSPFLDSLFIPVIVSCIPFLALGLIAESRVRRTGVVERPVYGAILGGVVGSILVFWLGWQQIEGFLFVAILLIPIWSLIAGGMLIGAGIGWLTNKLRPAH